MQHYAIVKNYILRLISLNEMIKKNNELDKLKCFLFDNDLIGIYENTYNPNLLQLKKETKNIWLETNYQRETILTINLDEKLNLIRNKYEKNFLEKNVLRVHDYFSKQK